MPAEAGKGAVKAGYHRTRWSFKRCKIHHCSDTNCKAELPGDTAFCYSAPYGWFSISYPRKYLDSLPNYEGAYPAHWSFDAAGVLLLVKALALSRTTEKGVIKAPPFGPAIGDPVEETIAVSPEISLVFLEGEHSAYGQSPWAAFEHLVDDTWFLDDNIEAMKQRLGEISLESESARNRENAVGTLNYAHIPDDVEMQTNATQPAVMTRSAVGPLG